MAEGFDLARGTLREHLKSLEARRLVERTGTKRHGPGRPHVIYGLTDAGEALFPSGEEERFVSQLVDGELERFAYMPDGDDSCSYVIRRPGK